MSSLWESDNRQNSGTAYFEFCRGIQAQRMMKDEGGEVDDPGFRT